MTEAVSPVTASDNACPVATALEISKAVVKAANPEVWWDLWGALEGGIREAQDASRRTGTAYPWDESEDVAFITWESFQSVLEHAIIATLPANSDIPQRQKLVQAAAAAYDRAMARGGHNGKALRQTRFGIKACSRCGTRFAARSGPGPDPGGLPAARGAV
jgi:hypothetical protein